MRVLPIPTKKARKGWQNVTSSWVVGLLRKEVPVDPVESLQLAPASRGSQSRHAEWAGISSSSLRSSAFESLPLGELNSTARADLPVIRYINRTVCPSGRSIQALARIWFGPHLRRRPDE